MPDGMSRLGRREELVRKLFDDTTKYMRHVIDEEAGYPRYWLGIVAATAQQLSARLADKPIPMPEDTHHRNILQYIILPAITAFTQTPTEANLLLARYCEKGLEVVGIRLQGEVNGEEMKGWPKKPVPAGDVVAKEEGSGRAPTEPPTEPLW